MAVFIFGKRTNIFTSALAFSSTHNIEQKRKIVALSAIILSLPAWSTKCGPSSGKPYYKKLLRENVLIFWPPGTASSYLALMFTDNHPLESL
jgi:hypothetical protein